MKKRKMAIFVPHQDDEVNLVGNILGDLIKKYDVYIIYSSLDISTEKAVIRKNEAINACKVYGIEKEKIIFLGFPDSPNRIGHHYFTDGAREIVQMIQEIIKMMKPEIVIGTDFDFHADHRMLSLALDDAIREILIENSDYKLQYLKGFCYETAYYGVDDYSASELENTKVIGDLLGNVSYRWEERKSVKSNEKNGFIFKKRAYKALKYHASQYAVLHARSIINADNVFWQKRTDNQMLYAEIYLMGNKSRLSVLNDFKVIDTDDIVSIEPTKIDYSKGVWKSENEREDIVVKWLQKVTIDRLVFHGNPNSEVKRELNLSVYDEKKNKICELDNIAERGRATSVYFEPLECKELLIKLVSKDKLIELSEIEAYFGDSELNILEPKLVRNNESKPAKNNFIDYLDLICFRMKVLITKIKRRIKNEKKKLFEKANYTK